MVTRRGFLQAAMVGIAAASISWRLSHGPIKLTERYTWEQPNPDYSYGINKKQPWDVLILDEREGEFITPAVLRDRGKLEFKNNPLPWTDEELSAPVKLQGEPEALMDPVDPPYNTFDGLLDHIDRAFGAYAAVVISQGYLGWEDAGKPGFDAPMKEIDEDVDAKIYTTSREYYADQELS
jgi:hypothetical protein